MSVNPRRYTGQLTQWGDRGYGFIVYEDDAEYSELVFAHRSQFRQIPGIEQFTPFPGLEVTFVIAKTRKGPMALDIEIVGGLEVNHG
jgi:cold shock CspA family protein